MNGPLWDQALKDRLEQLWTTSEEGKFLSASEVGRRLNLSRGQVLGQVRRMMLVRDGAKPREPKERPVLLVSTPGGHGDNWVMRHFQPEKPLVSKLEDEPKSLTASLPGEWRVRRGEPCCFPIGTPGTKAFRFCDEPSVAGKPYCGLHAAVAYVACPERKAEVAYG